MDKKSDTPYVGRTFEICGGDLRAEVISEVEVGSEEFTRLKKQYIRDYGLHVFNQVETGPPWFKANIYAAMPVGKGKSDRWVKRPKPELISQGPIDFREC